VTAAAKPAAGDDPPDAEAETTEDEV